MSLILNIYGSTLVTCFVSLFKHRVIVFVQNEQRSVFLKFAHSFYCASYVATRFAYYTFLTIYLNIPSIELKPVLKNSIRKCSFVYMKETIIELFMFFSR